MKPGAARWSGPSSAVASFSEGSVIETASGSSIPVKRSVRGGAWETRFPSASQRSRSESPPSEGSVIETTFDEDRPAETHGTLLPLSETGSVD